MTDLLDLDFESFYDSANGYTLKKMSMLEYILDERFFAFGFSAKWIGSPEPSRWYYGEKAMKDFLATIDWSKTDLLGQNVKFDGGILGWRYGIVPRRYVDTLAMSRAILGRRLSNHSLATVANYFGLPPKGFLKTDGLRALTQEQADELGVYCNQDVALAEGIYQRLLPSFPDSQWSIMDWTIKCFTRPLLKLNGDVAATTWVEEKARRDAIFAHVGLPKEVFSSSDQFAKLLTERGFEVPTKISAKTKKSIPAFAANDEEFIEMCESENDELRDLCTARLAAKSTTLETRAAKFIKIAKFGIFPFDIHFSGAHTHRFSGGNGAGGNPQNLKNGSGLRRAVCV